MRFLDDQVFWTWILVATFQGSGSLGLISDQSTSDANLVIGATPVNRNYALIFVYGFYLEVRRSTR
jgi:hypothetical protein